MVDKHFLFKKYLEFQKVSVDLEQMLEKNPSLYVLKKAPVDFCKKFWKKLQVF